MTTTKYAVEMSTIRYTVTGIAHVWTSATPHLYMRPSAAARFADSLTSPTTIARVIAVQGV